MVFGGGWYEAYGDRQVYLWMEKSKYKLIHWYYKWCLKIGVFVSNSICFINIFQYLLINSSIEYYRRMFMQQSFLNSFLFYSSHVCESMSFVSVIFLNIRSSKKINGCILSRFRLTITLCLWLYFGPLIFIVLWTKEAIMKNKKFSHIYSVEIK